MNLISDDADICICTDLDEVLKPGWGKELRRVAEENPTASQIYYYYAWSGDKVIGEANPTYRDAYIRLAQKFAYSNRPAECFEVLKEAVEMKLVQIS